MTPEELRQQYPDVVTQIENAAREVAASEAVTAERSRLQEIETIEATVGDPELIKEAKYGPTACSAQELAFKAMKSRPSSELSTFRTAPTTLPPLEQPESAQHRTQERLHQRIRQPTKTLR